MENYQEFREKYIDVLAEEDIKDLYESKWQKEHQEKANKRQEDMETYKKLVTEGVDELFPVLENLSLSLAQAKKNVYDRFNTALDLKKDLFRVKESQYNHTFINEKKNRRITLGNITKDGFDDTVNEGIQMVKDYISSLATDAASQELVNTVLQLLSKDNKGNLKASKIVTLNNLAAKSDSQLFKEGVDIIQKAYTPEVSKQYVRVERKNEHGMWVSVPLGMTEV
ncbi:MAG: hypothetical protein H6Q15_2088 [Bacteroidetes bacterium]|nr:hypothetical protein [Bacteroidota bacterium]